MYFVETMNCCLLLLLLFVVKDSEDYDACCCCFFMECGLFLCCNVLMYNVFWLNKDSGLSLNYC